MLDQLPSQVASPASARHGSGAAKIAAAPPTAAPRRRSARNARRGRGRCAGNSLTQAAEQCADLGVFVRGIPPKIAVVFLLVSLRNLVYHRPFLILQLGIKKPPIYLSSVVGQYLQFNHCVRALSPSPKWAHQPSHNRNLAKESTQTIPPGC